MGNFSYISKNDNEALDNPWRRHTLCELQFVVSGKVVEKMRGVYSGYGAVYYKAEDVNHTGPVFQHWVRGENDEWVEVTEQTVERMKAASNDGAMWTFSDWGDMVFNYMFSDDPDNTDGIAAWHLRDMNSVVPEADSQSGDDPYQGDRLGCQDDDDEDEYYDEEDDCEDGRGIW